MRLTKLFSDFFNSEKTSGIILLCCTILSMALANSSFSETYVGFWETKINGHSLAHWINDGLMAIFFLLIGLELEREIYKGELSDIKSAMLPIVAALGGVVVPAGIYLALNWGTATQGGAGIPMATDIAFAIGMLALLGSRVPASLKVFLTALAVIDDLCAILVIAIFYTSDISMGYLGGAAGIFALMLVLNRLKVMAMWPYLILGVGMWYCMLHSGIHATLSGVLTAFAIPFGSGGKKSTSYILQHALHKPVAFIIVPVFALANTCIVFEPGWMDGMFTHAGIGIYAGLVAGKPIGILLFSSLAVIAGLCALPSDLKWKHITGASILAGIGFTMSIFVTMLAFTDNASITLAKTAIIFASLTAAIAGLIWLSVILKQPQPREDLIQDEDQ
ncbi:MAG TPA: Na+/H+ antiporter NhaA [Ferruginibacter sp.]|nr:Na+/H+ antiporter NhaA [Ferruginibacter sp.]